MRSSSTHSVLDQIAALASEEEDDIYVVDSPELGKYIIAFDPLDGSSNIDVNVSVGSIFAIWRRPNYSVRATARDWARIGGRWLLHLWQFYTIGACVRQWHCEWVHIRSFYREFILTHPNLRIPERGNIYSINEGNSAYWDEAM